MHFPFLLTSGLGTGLTSVGFFAAIAVLACILGAEIACIGVLISKAVRASRAKRAFEEQEHRHYAIGLPITLLGAIPQSAYITLSALSIAVAVAAVIFLVLLVIFRLKGYDFASAAWRRREQDARAEAAQSKAEPMPEAEDEPLALFAQETSEVTYAADESEEQMQEALTEVDSLEDNEQSTALEPIFSDANGDETVSETQRREMTVETVSADPMAADGARPYKVVEKIVTETVKEVVKETPPAQPAAGAQGTSATDAVMEKLTEFLDYELQKRREQEQGTAKSSDSVATFAKSEAMNSDEDAEDEDEDLDEDEAEEGEAAEADVDDEADEVADDRFTGNERIIGFNDETGCYIVAHYRKSFEAKLVQARPNIKEYYSELKNALLSYKGTKNRISWTADSFHNGRTQIAKINVKTRILEIYLALDPATLEGTVYRGTDVGSKKKYAETPFRYKLRTPRKFKWAMELVQRTCEEHGLSPIDIEKVDYVQQYPFDTTENLITRKLIKEYIREEKPATSFELAPDHVPQMPEEDESVIPANANFSWEFDNERMEEQEEPAPEPVSEPEVIAEPEPTPEPSPAPASEPTVVRETVKITEMRYTERYYAEDKPTYEQVITTAEQGEEARIEPQEEQTAGEPIEASFEAVTENGDDRIAAIFDEELSEEPAEETVEQEPAEEAAEEWEELPEEEERFFDAPACEAEPEEAEEQEPETVAEPLPFRPSFYANRNYYEDEPTISEPEDEAEELPYEEAVEEQEPVEQVPPTPARPADPSVAVVDICAIEHEFPQGATVSLQSLKAKELILSSAKTLKVDASGALSKPLVVEANHITFQAAMAILSAGGEALQIQ